VTSVYGKLVTRAVDARLIVASGQPRGSKKGIGDPAAICSELPIRRRLPHRPVPAARRDGRYSRTWRLSDLTALRLRYGAQPQYGCARRRVPAAQNRGATAEV